MGLFTKDIKTMSDLFVHQLQDIYYAEKQLVKALPKMAEKATDKQLKQGFLTHLEETRTHVQRLEEVFRMHGADVKAVDCPAIDGIIEEADEVTGEVADKSVLDAALINAAQAAEHYEIVRYGSLIAWAKQLGRNDCASVLQKTLDEEKATDKKLNIGRPHRLDHQRREALDQHTAQQLPGRRDPRLGADHLQTQARRGQQAGKFPGVVTGDVHGGRGAEQRDGAHDRAIDEARTAAMCERRDVALQAGVTGGEIGIVRARAHMVQGRLRRRDRLRRVRDGEHDVGPADRRGRRIRTGSPPAVHPTSAGSKPRTSVACSAIPEAKAAPASPRPRTATRKGDAPGAAGFSSGALSVTGSCRADRLFVWRALGDRSCRADRLFVWRALSVTGPPGTRLRACGERGRLSVPVIAGSPGRRTPPARLRIIARLPGDASQAPAAELPP